MNNRTFIYEALNQRGEEMKGEILAPSAEKALEQMRNEGMFPTRIRENTVKIAHGRIKIDSPAVFSCLMVIAMLAAATLVWVVWSAMEARTYNRITGNNVSTWEAMWIRCQIVGDPQAERD